MLTREITEEDLDMSCTTMMPSRRTGHKEHQCRYEVQRLTKKGIVTVKHTDSHDLALQFKLSNDWIIDHQE